MIHPAAHYPDLTGWLDPALGMGLESKQEQEPEPQSDPEVDTNALVGTPKHIFSSVPMKGKSQTLSTRDFENEMKLKEK